MAKGLTFIFRRLLVSILLGAAIGYVYGAATPAIASVGAYVVALYEYPLVYSGRGEDPTTLNTVTDWLLEASPFPPSYSLINLGIGYGLLAGAIVGLVNVWVEGLFLYFIYNRHSLKLYGYLLGALGGYVIAANVFLSTIDITNPTSLQHYLYTMLFVLPVWMTVVVAMLLLRANLVRHLRTYRRLGLQAEREAVLASSIRNSPMDGKNAVPTGSLL
jgi:hypothetical protein